MPVFHTFTAGGKRYMFDANTNVIINLKEDLYFELEKYMQSGYKEITPAIEKLRDRGYLKDRADFEMVHPMDSTLEYSLERCIGTIALQVTQGCNLRCKYCAYSGSYDNRVHSSKRMSKEIAFKAILTNQAYIGSAVHGKVVIEKYNNIPLHATDPSEWVIVENTHEPLVDKETFEKAQERVKEISDAYFAKEFTKHPPNEKNLLKGKIVCGDCGKGMRLSPRTTKSYVYFCGTFSDGINPACSRHKIDQEDVNKAVFAQISNHMRCCIDALRVIRELNARSSGLKKYDVYEKAITRQRRELEKVNRKFSELYGDYSEHLINESEYLTLKQQYLLKSEALKKEIDNLLISQNLYSKNYKIDADWENLINKYLKCRKLNKELADAFVDKVQVFEGGRISVNLVYDDCLEELLQVKNKREGDLNE